jgi:histidinol phosphatase-like PHP family hydrolase
MPSIAPFSTPGRFWRGNLHTHSNLSDGGLAPEAVIAAYKRNGYDFLQLSEHFLDRYGWPIADTRAFRSNAFATLIGAELHAVATSVGELWHILAVGLPLDFPAPGKAETGPELVRRAREAGAFVAIAHPAWSQLTEDDGRALDAAHAVEIYNHGCAVETDRGDGFYLLDRLSNLGRRLTAIATDDAHFNHGERDAFGGFVAVKAESLEAGALLAALKAGHFYASQGPRLHDVRVGRDEIVVETSPVETVALLTGASRALHVSGSHIARAVFDLSGAGKKSWTETGPDAWFRVVAIDAAGRRAWTNPIWLDALG